MLRKRVYFLSEKLRVIKDYVLGEKGVMQICIEMIINIVIFYEWL